MITCFILPFGTTSRLVPDVLRVLDGSCSKSMSVMCFSPEPWSDLICKRILKTFGCCCFCQGPGSIIVN